jgi:protocatechuate 3,4-dioxygenase beta subunit
VGELLSAQARSPQRPAHIHFLLYRQGFETLITQLFVDTPEALQADVVFGVDGALVAEPEAAQDPDGPVQRLTYTFTLQPGRSRLPRPPIK